jgi:hypothetical protein
MRNLILVVILFITACQQSNRNETDVRWSENGKDSVVYIQHRNEDGSNTNFYMNYLLYRSLFDNGGYGRVNGYYQTHPQEFSQASQSLYNNYKPAIKSYSSSPSRSYSTPSVEI